MRDRLFISYSRADRVWMERFQTTLAPAKRSGVFEVWADSDIRTGAEWLKSITAAIDRSRVALLLVSQNFLDSGFIGDVELPRILAAQRNRGLTIYWVLIADCLHEQTSLHDLQAPWPLDKPLESLPERETQSAIAKICRDVLSGLGQYSHVSLDAREVLKEQIAHNLPGHYVLLEEIGSGQHSIVYKGSQRGREVVLKVLVGSPLDRSSYGIMQAKAEAAMRLKHKVYISILDSYMDRDPPLVVTEYLDYPTLGERLGEDGPMAFDRVIGIIGQLGEALQEAHEMGMVHGNIKASNVFLDERDGVKLSGYGFWNAIDHAERVAGNFLVNPEAISYLIPEQYHGWTPDRLADQYALGLLAFEMMEGKPPVRVRFPVDLEKKRAFFSNPAEFAGPWIREYPVFANVLMRMLQERPAARYPTMREALSELRRIEEQRVTIAKSVYTRHCFNNQAFYEHFYRALFAKRPGLTSLFDDAKMDRQYRALDGAMINLLNFGSQPVQSEPTILTLVAQRHLDMGLTVEDFEAFGSALLDTLKDRGSCNADELAIWAQVIKPGMSYMIRHAARSGDA